MAQLPLLAMTMGEPAGVGPEVAIKAWLARREADIPPFAWIGGTAVIAERARECGLDVPIAEITVPDQARDCFNDSFPVFPLDMPPVFAGGPGPQSAAAVLQSIEYAASFCFEGLVGGMVTSPIKKSLLYDAGFDARGHTDHLERWAANAWGQEVKALMMLAVPGLRTVPLVVHEPLSAVSSMVSTEGIIELVGVLDRALKDDLGVDAPRIAVAGLNPHAGEDGRLGNEEADFIVPAIAHLRQQGLEISGPFPADSLFHEAARETYDAAVCMYHDQALIPLKTLNFYEGVNITLGLPLVRTSPDHGTAPDIASSFKADPRSMIAALKTAGEIATRRQAAR